MTVSLAEATAAARRIQAGYPMVVTPESANDPIRPVWYRVHRDTQYEPSNVEARFLCERIRDLRIERDRALTKAAGAEDARLLAGFVLAGDMERLRTALDEPYRCVICGKDLTPTPEQLEALRRFGNPLRREPCLLTEDGQHRVDSEQIRRRGDAARAALAEGRS